MNNTDKHAYCIMAHDNWEQLQLLINLLDDKRNDLFLHIDAKSLDVFNKSGGVKVKNSNLFFIENVDVRWSDISQTDTEVSLFKKVISTGIKYSRIHLISGADLPIKSQDYIHDFFSIRSEEFIDFKTNPMFIKRIKYYHFFVRCRRKYILADLFRRIFLLFQIPFVNRLKHSKLKYAYGANWCSLTYQAVKEIINQYPKFRYMFRYTTSSDELYKQMILQAGNFSFAKEGCMRYVVFNHKAPSPKILTMADFDAISSSGCIFARKFNLKVDKNIINKVISFKEGKKV